MGFLIAALALALLFCLRVSVRVKTGDETHLTAGIGFIKISLFPMKEKAIKLKKFEIGRFRKWHSKLSGGKKNKAKKSAVKSEDNEAAKSGEMVSDVLAMLNKFSRVIKVFLTRFGHYLRIDAREVVLIVASGDAATTAVMYGAAVGAVQNLYALLVSTGNFHTGHSSRFIVEPDFTAVKSSVRIDVKFSFRLWQLIAVAARTLIEYLRDGGESAETA